MRAIAIAIILAALPMRAMGQDSKGQDRMGQDSKGGAMFEKVQSDFAEAYNRKDLDAMAAAFAENAVRVTPSGTFIGRDAVRRSFQDALNLGLHDYSVNRMGSRAYGELVLNFGEWRAELGSAPLHGYYTAILGREGDQVKILEETVTVAAPGK